VYVLFDHKSYYDRYVHLQLLEYMVRVVQSLFKHVHDPDFLKKLPAILSMMMTRNDISIKANNEIVECFRE
jgi:Putative transposase, YhgA-like